MRRRLTLFLLLVLTGCGGDKGAVEAVAKMREKALNTGDAALYASLLSPTYNDKGKDYRTERAELESALRGGPVSYRSLSRTIEVHGETAAVTGRYAMKATLRGRPLELTGEENLRLRREAGGWRITGGL